MNQETAVQTVEQAEVQASPMVSLIERVATDPNVPFDKLEKMLEMQERLWAREARQAFDNAIAGAKSEIPTITKTGTVDYVNTKGQRTHFKHETLDGIAKVVDPILSKHGLSYRFRSEQKDGGLHVTCILAHRDGHSEETTLQGAPDTSGSKNSYQAVGSSATYLQRYTLKLALGLSASDDDDGNAAGDGSTITAEQYQHLKADMEATGTDPEKFAMLVGCESIMEMPVALYQTAVNLLSVKKNKGASQ